MPLSPFLPKLPRTAADLLDGLLRSQLFAESIFGQILEQSRPYLDHSAEEFAAALVQKNVLMPWQAEELLAGRQGMYAGTFRLLDRLEQGANSSLFIAEQPGVQRLVFLLAIRSGIAFQGSPEPVASRLSPGHPRMARCVQAQLTPRLRLVAYEFFEARTLTGLLGEQQPERKYQADLLQQYAKTLANVSDEALDWIGPEAVLINRHGQLKLLAGFKNGVASQLSREREARQLAAVFRLARLVGDFPEIADCRSLGAVIDRLSEFAEPWSVAYTKDSLQHSRTRMNRFLRKGPAVRLIEVCGPEQQVDFERSEPAPAVPGIATPVPDSNPISPQPHPLSGLDELAIVIRQERRTATTTAKPRVRSWSRHLFLSALLGMIVTGVLATQWFDRWDLLRRIGEASESQIHPEKLPGREGMPRAAPLEKHSNPLHH